MFNYQAISQAVFDGNAEAVLTLCTQAIREGYPADLILEMGLMDGMNQVAEKFKHERVLVPEVLLSTRAMHAGLSKVEPYLKTKALKKKTKVILGTVEGDLHDIGKNLIKILLSTIGIEVVDLGVNVTAAAFANAVRKEKCSILMMSALLTTTLPAMQKVIAELELKGLRQHVKVFVGGAPVSEAFAKEIGADYYFEDAFELREFLEKNLVKLLSK